MRCEREPLICLIVGLVSLFSLAACEGGVDEPKAKEARPFVVTSPFLEPGGEIPTESTCDGGDKAPIVSWEGASAAEYVVTLTDVDADDFAHWIVYGLPRDSTDLTRDDEDLAVGREGENDFGDVGYRGPCPPEGDGPHDYVITVYALDEAVTSDLDEGATLEEVIDQIECCVRAKGILEATYER